MKQSIDTGDRVKHGPTNEIWIVAFAKDDKVVPCGWPLGYAELSDCDLIETASDEYRAKLLFDMSQINEDDPRKDYAVERLKESFLKP